MQRVPKWRRDLIKKMEAYEEKTMREREIRSMNMSHHAWTCKGCGQRMAWHRKKVKFINKTLGLEFNFHNQKCKIDWIHNFKKRNL